MSRRLIVSLMLDTDARLVSLGDLLDVRNHILQVESYCYHTGRVRLDRNYLGSGSLYEVVSFREVHVR